jgi:hypothetical protein
MHQSLLEIIHLRLQRPVNILKSHLNGLEFRVYGQVQGSTFRVRVTGLGLGISAMEIEL